MNQWLSFFMVFYLVFQISMPFHAIHDCDHFENTEQHESDHPENQCCPPFSVCKVCSLFVYELIWHFEGLQFEPIQSTNTVLIQAKYPTSNIQIWQPPKLA